MKKWKFRSPERVCVLVLGLYLYLLRRSLFSLAVDEKGLLPSLHPLELALWAVLLVGTALTFAVVRKRKGSEAYGDNFPASSSGAVGHFLLAAGILLLVRAEGPGWSLLSGMRTVLGWVCVPALLWAGVCRWKGRMPSFLTHGVVCLFFLLQLILQYRVWSGDPQMQDYIFELLALVALVLFSYQYTAFEADMGSGKKQLAYGLLAVLLCGGALAGTRMRILFLTGGFWALTNLCALTPEQEAPHEAA